MTLNCSEVLKFDIAFRHSFLLVLSFSLIFLVLKLKCTTLWNKKRRNFIPLISWSNEHQNFLCNDCFVILDVATSARNPRNYDNQFVIVHFLPRYVLFFPRLSTFLSSGKSNPQKPSTKSKENNTPKPSTSGKTFCSRSSAILWTRGNITLEHIHLGLTTRTRPFQRPLPFRRPASDLQ